jgi:hypothetical protein
MGDYVVRLVGKDDLSSTVRNVKKELSDVGKVGKDAMSKIDDKFQRIITSSAPLKRQLKDLRAIMSDMNLKGLSNTNEFTKIAVEAGRIKDAIDDASEAVTRFSNDTMGLQATIQAFQGIAAAGSVATGVMALFGNENKEAVIAIQKVQGALAILNGVQTIANMLNENSIVVLKMKQLAQMAFNRSAIQGTANIAANTTATANNTAAIAANTAAQRTMNTTFNVGKMAIGGWLAVITVGIGLLSAYSAHAAKTKAAQAEMNSILEQSKQTQKSYTDVMASTYSNLATKYTQLRNEYIKLSNEHQKTEWITKNKTELDNLHLSVDGINSADNVFINNTSSVVQAFIKRAQAAARLAQLTDLYRQKYEIMQNIADDAKKGGRSAQEGDEITDATFRNKRYGSVNKAGKWVFSKEGAALYSGNANGNNPQIAKLDSSINSLTAEMQKEGDFNTPSNIPTTSTPTKTSGGGRNVTNPIDDTPKFAEGSLTDLETQLRDLQQNLKDGLIPSDKVEETKVTIERLKEDILKKKIEIGLEVDPILKDNEELKNKLLEQVSSIISDNRNIETQPKLSTFDKAIGNNPFDTNTLDGIERMIDFNDTLIGKLEETRNKIIMLQMAFVSAGLEGTEQFVALNKELENVNGTISTVSISQETLTNKAKETAEAQKKQEEFITTLNDISDAASNTGEIFKSLGQISDDETLNAAGIIAEAIANIIGGYAQASAQSAKLGPWAWAAFSLAGLAQVASVIAQIHNLSGYAEGGIIGGGSRHGDAILGRLNAGEMVLNTRQQSNLFKALDNGNFESVYNGDSQRVDFRIKGQDLYGTLKNFSKTAAKSGKITGIQ